MTKIAAEMEKQPSIHAFTDVLDYDMERNHWNIPGLWHGTPPMAPVNTGYSEAVAHFKKSLLETVNRDRSDQFSLIPDFLEFMKSLWKAVKYEKFIFSFRNTLVAHAYDNLCCEFNNWEWDFRKEILYLQKAAELEILNADNESTLETLNKFVESKISEMFGKISDQKEIMNNKLCDYYKSKDKHVNLIEKHKMDFIHSINSVENEIKRSVETALKNTYELKKGSKQVQDIQRKYTGEIEKQVMKLLKDCKGSKLTDEQLTREFEQMWTKATETVPGPTERDIPACVLNQLKNSFSNRNVNEKLPNTEELKELGKDKFKIRKEHTEFFVKKYLWSRDLQTFTDNVIEISTQFVLDKTKTNEDYHDTLTRDLLVKVDESLKQSYKQYKTNKQFEIDLKLHICGFASREFLKMHKKFISDNDPRIQLEMFKTQYMSDFLDLYKERDDCQRKANDFVRCCIKPDVEEYISRSLGIEIVDELLTSSHSAEFSSRSFFQYNIQKELLEKEDFESFVKFIRKYEIYVKDWIFQCIRKKISEDKTLCKLKKKNLHIIVQKITEATQQASKGEDGAELSDTKESITKLIQNMRKLLIRDISISKEAEKTTLFQIQSTCSPFKDSLIKSLTELEEQLKEDFSNSEDVAETLKKLPIKPQDELFKRVFGCGQQCPFCKVPCEAGGKDHKTHHASVHRPQGLGTHRYEDSKKLVETLCTTDINTERRFRKSETKGEWHPYKDYTTYYPDWHIPPDPFPRGI
ncbi:hypothetical protein L3Q82_000047 [Scortum barcoo]|uniref:Uncharacterized protein n=1 Tax=Scortum barcoo TaxID=214431 RepID=A0ACB8XAV1_9TELE|nr:hypothetical protein L3Q82_000047 [Scortum barcoo]